MKNKNCFAYNGTSCKVLKTLVCKGAKCSFYKSKKEYKEEMKKHPPIDYKKYKEMGIKKTMGRV